MSKKYNVINSNNRALNTKKRSNLRTLQRPFSNNIVSNKLHTKGKDATGYIKREVYIKDKYGNVKIAKETQMIASWNKMTNFKLH